MNVEMDETEIKMPAPCCVMGIAYKPNKKLRNNILMKWQERSSRGQLTSWVIGEIVQCILNLDNR
jgi:hypothetical protein